MKRHLSKRLSLTLCFLLIFSTFVPVFGATASNDYENHWAKTTIQSAMASGISNGYPDGSFKPDNPITRAEFFALVNNAFKFNAASAKTYNDVPMNAWYAPVISRADSAGYITGYPDGGIHPESNITRQEAAVIMSKVKALAPTTANVTFTDAASIAEWSMPAVRAVANAKIMNGYPDGTFKPTMQIKRAEALVTVMNSLLYSGQPPQGVPSTTGDTTYTSGGTYGPETGSTTVNGNVTIQAAGVTLQNTKITGDLTIAKEVGDGEVTLRSVTVGGMVHVYGGGENSVYFVNVTAGTVHVMKDDGPVRLVISGASTIDDVSVESDVTLEETDLSTGAGIDGITVENTADGITVTLVGVDCDSITVEADDVILDLDEDSTVTDLTVNGANLEVNGEGDITNAKINGNGSDFQNEPTNVDVAEGIDEPTITPRSSGGGGGGGGGGSSRTAISGIGNITGDAKVGAALTAGALTPSGATASYQWQISDTADGTYTDISGATGATYTPAGADLGKFIKVKATGTGNYTGTQTSAATAAVAEGPISPAAIVGVTAPVVGATPVSTIAETDAYTATVTWSPNDPTFMEGVVYTATITLTPKAGYIVAGIPANYFTVAGAETVTNAADSAVVTAVFPIPSTGDIEITDPVIAGVAKPVAGEIPATTVTETAAYTGTVTWSPNDSPFMADKDYTATITLTPKAGYTLTGVAANFFTVEGATATNPADSGVITAVFTAETAAEWTYEPVGAGVRITAYSGNTGNVAIPLEFEGAPVTQIGDSVFEGKAITGITIPATVTNIRQFAFRNCANLTAVEIPNGVTTIGQQAFRNCDQLTSVVIPNSVTNIGIGAFSGCASLNSITIPDSVTAIGGQMFLGTALENVTLPNTLTSIGEEAFADTMLTSVVLPDSLTTIENYAFSAPELTSVTIGDGVTIGLLAFPGGDVLKTAYDNVTTGGAGTYTYDGSVWTKEGSGILSETNLTEVVIDQPEVVIEENEAVLPDVIPEGDLLEAGTVEGTDNL